MRCPSCGAEGEGKFCTRCGAARSEEERRCAGCGGGLAADDLFCGECGEPTGRRPARPFSAKLPWILSAGALVFFSVGIALLVQRSTAPRSPGGMITGGIPSAGDGAMAGTAGSDAGGAAGAGGEADARRGSGMPSAAELAAMPPRVAADRLFERAMTEGESGDLGRADFFARMALQAYGRVPPAEMDDDARFHVGLLHLTVGDLDAARAAAEALRAGNPSHLFGLVLGARVAEAAGDAGAAASYRDRLRSAIAAGESPEETPYAPHAALIHREAESDGGG